MIRFACYSDLPDAARGSHALIFAAYCGAQRLVDLWLLRNRASKEVCEIALLAAVDGAHEEILARLLASVGNALSDEFCTRLAAVLKTRGGEAGSLDSARQRCILLLLESQPTPAEKVRISRAIVMNESSGKLKARVASFLAKQL